MWATFQPRREILINLNLNLMMRIRRAFSLRKSTVTPGFFFLNEEKEFSNANAQALLTGWNGVYC